jgi:hypothetical protein
VFDARVPTAEREENRAAGLVQAVTHEAVLPVSFRVAAGCVAAVLLRPTAMEHPPAHVAEHRVRPLRPPPPDTTGARTVGMGVHPHLFKVVDAPVRVGLCVLCLVALRARPACTCLSAAVGVCSTISAVLSGNGGRVAT